MRVGYTTICQYMEIKKIFKFTARKLHHTDEYAAFVRHIVYGHVI